MKGRSRCCSRSGCDEPVSGVGLCAAHYSEHLERIQRRDQALDVLHGRIADTDARNNGALKKEWESLRLRWVAACRAINTGHGTGVMPTDEAEYAVEWCIRLAEELLIAEPTLAANGSPPGSLTSTRQWVGERFANLDKGLMSNGLPRGTA